MFLTELFDQPTFNIEETLRSSVENVLIPLVAQGVPYTTVDAIIDNLSDSGIKSMGLRIDRALVMQLLDPDKTSIVKKVEGDRVYLTLPTPDVTAKSERDEEQDIKHVQNTATAQAKKNITK